jgi:hypothetical protein
MAHEVDARAKWSMQLALARLGVQQYVDALRERLRVPGGVTPSQSARIRYEALADVEYVHNGKAFLAELESLLGDRSDVRNLGGEPYPLWHRLCDRVVDTLPSLTGTPLPFPTGGRRYSDSELQQAKDHLQKSFPP